MFALRPRLTLFALFIVVLFFSVYRLDSPTLWSDEASTGVLGRNTLNHGAPFAFDGRNAEIFAECYGLTRGLVYNKPPFLQHYLAAASFFLLGVSTFSARIAFACIGACALFPIAAVLRDRTRYGDVVAAIALLSPQALMFHRNARYYSLLTTAVAVLVWLAINRPWGNRRRAFAIGVCLLCLLYSHHFVGLCCAAALLVYVAVWRRVEAKITVLATLSATIVWLASHVVSGVGASETLTNAQIAFEHGQWLNHALIALTMQLADLDYVNSAPLLLWVAGGAVLLATRFRSETHNGLMALLACLWGTHMLAVAMALGYETNVRYAILRYMPHIVTIGAVMSFFLLRSILPNENVAIIAFLLLNIFNVASVSFWLSRSDRPPQALSWWPPVYGEIVHPPPDAWQEAARWMEANAPRDSLVAVSPRFMNSVFIFYGGAQFYFVPDISPGVSCANTLRDEIGAEAMKRLGAGGSATPDWIITAEGSVPADYVERFSIRARTFPGATRPELTRHRFAHTVIDQKIVIYSHDPP